MRVAPCQAVNHASKMITVRARLPGVYHPLEANTIVTVSPLCDLALLPCNQVEHAFN
jgi:hypothetical protein